MMDTGTKELAFVLVMMGVFLIIALVAVVVFIRVWHKEKKERKR